jgi:uncharacterized membrane protein YecN with MAPEG domain
LKIALVIVLGNVFTEVNLAFTIIIHIVGNLFIFSRVLEIVVLVPQPTAVLFIEFELMVCSTIDKFRTLFGLVEDEPALICVDSECWEMYSRGRLDL